MGIRCFYIILLTIFPMGCSGNEDKLDSVSFSSNECEQNWGICTVYDKGKYKNSGDSTVKIAILDSGINSNLAILKGKVKETYNAINKDSETLDELGHGTMIASIIAAEENPHNVIGVNPNAELYDVQVLNSKGGGEIEDVIDGIHWSIDRKVDIINLSFGFEKDDPKLKEAISLALSNDILVVASAGNTLGLYTHYPATYKGVYSISAIDKDLKKYKLAAKGKIDYVAPGVEIPVYNQKGETIIQSGTSLATAYATGVISILMSKEDSSVDLGLTFKSLGKKDDFGLGLLLIK
ncbi:MULTISPECIES: S8 family peptidase [unclassified Lysinibacillus]|uniref:S8 family peptidase n=1 Tax=unclassified Lysinibacillus TaxID=2636778 RepID=UPI0038169608